jgi:hypothetical protein
LGQAVDEGFRENGVCYSLGARFRATCRTRTNPAADADPRQLPEEP